MTRWQHAVLRHHHSLLWAFGVVWVAAAIGVWLGVWPLRGHGPALVVSLVACLLLSVWVRWQREQLMREAPLPQFLKRKLREAYPHLSAKDCDLVERGLRQFFLACLRSQRKFVAMPSRAVDAMWHEFILHTKAYGDWCAVALGHFLHHTPAETLGPKASTNDGLRRAWYWACRDEAIAPRTPTRLPLLFALDAKLAIPNGFVYAADCGQHFQRRNDGNGGDGGAVHCGTHFSDGSHSGDADGLGGSDSGGSGSDGGGDGGGCGGGGD